MLKDYKGAILDPKTPEDSSRPQGEAPLDSLLLLASYYF